MTETPKAKLLREWAEDLCGFKEVIEDLERALSTKTCGRCASLSAQLAAALANAVPEGIIEMMWQRDGDVQRAVSDSGEGEWWIEVNHIGSRLPVPSTQADAIAAAETETPEG